MIPQETIPENICNLSVIGTNKAVPESSDTEPNIPVDESIGQTINPWLGLIGHTPQQPAAQPRAVLLCTTETMDESVQLTPIRKRRKRENHRNDPLVIECRKRRLEGVPLYRIAGDLTLDYLIVARWDKRGWLDQQPLKKKGLPAEIEEDDNDSED